MKRSSLWIAVTVLLVSVLFAGCEYKELCYDHRHGDKPNLYLKLDLKLDLDIDIVVTDEDHTKIEIPSHMVVCRRAVR